MPPLSPAMPSRARETPVIDLSLAPACSTPPITTTPSARHWGGDSPAQLLPECGAPPGYAPPQLHHAVMPESPPHQGPAIYLSRQLWGTAQRYHPLHSIPTRVAAPAPGTQHPYGTHMFSASGHNDFRTAMAAVHCLLGNTIARTARAVQAPPPCLMWRGRHFSGDLRRENYPGLPKPPRRGLT